MQFIYDPPMSDTYVESAKIPSVAMRLRGTREIEYRLHVCCAIYADNPKEMPARGALQVKTKLPVISMSRKVTPSWFEYSDLPLTTEEAMETRETPSILTK